MARKWVKLYCKKWLDGTMSYELTDAQVGIWSKLLALAGEYAEYKETDGFIPLPLEAIRRRVKSDPRTFDRAIERLKITERIKIDDGGIFLLNFNHYNPTRSEIWDAENPEKAYLRKLRYEKDTRLPPTKPDGTEEDIDKDKDIDILSSSLEDVVKWVKEQEWWSTFKADYPQFKESDLLSALQWLRAKGKRYKLLNRYFINWARKIPPPPSKGRVPEVYTKVEDL